MSSRQHNNLFRTAGALVGMSLAVFVLVDARPAAHGSPLPATVRVSVVATGELEVTPPTPRAVLLADSLVPGRRPATGTFGIRNQTGSTLEVALRTSANSTALDGLVRLRLTSGDRRLASTTLQGLKDRVIHLRLASGMESRLRLDAWIPADVNDGYQGRLVQVSLDPKIRVLGGPA